MPVHGGRETPTTGECHPYIHWTADNDKGACRGPAEHVVMVLEYPFRP